MNANKISEFSLFMSDSVHLDFWSDFSLSQLGCYTEIDCNRGVVLVEIDIKVISVLSNFVTCFRIDAAALSGIGGRYGLGLGCL